MAGATWSLTSGGRVHSGGARPRGVMGMRILDGEDGGEVYEFREKVMGRATELIVVGVLGVVVWWGLTTGV